MEINRNTAKTEEIKYLCTEIKLAGSYHADQFIQQQFSHKNNYQNY